MAKNEERIQKDLKGWGCARRNQTANYLQGNADHSKVVRTAYHRERTENGKR